MKYELLLMVLAACSAAGLNASLSKTEGTVYDLLVWLTVPMKSHHILFDPIIRGILERGHRVTLVTPYPLKDPPPNLEQIIIQDQFSVLMDLIKNQALLDKILPWRLKECYLKYQESFYKDPIIQDFLKSDRKFDGILMEVIMSESFIGLHHKYNAPIINVLPLPHYHWTYYVHGIPYDTSYVADSLVPYTDHMTFLERLHNTAQSIGMRMLSEFFFAPLVQGIMDKHLIYPGWQDRPSAIAMTKNVSLVLINTHFSISYSYPIPPHAKEIAGISVPTAKPLPQELQEFMDSATQGAIVFSLGSHISMEKTLGPEKIEIFRQVFSKLKLKVLWKLDSEIKDLPNNVKLTKWFPQSDILAHKNCRLFISHCGYHSSVETIYHSVPVMAIPVQADQMKNARMLTHYGIALLMNLDNVTEGNVAWTLNQLIENPIYKQNAIRRSNIYKDQKEKPLESATYWIEYVLRHNGAHHLKPAILSLSWYQQALIDVYATLAFILCVPLILTYYLIKCSINRCRGKSKESSKKKRE